MRMILSAYERNLSTLKAPSTLGSTRHSTYFAFTLKLFENKVKSAKYELHFNEVFVFENLMARSQYSGFTRTVMTPVGL